MRVSLPETRAQWPTITRQIFEHAATDARPAVTYERWDCRDCPGEYLFIKLEPEPQGADAEAAAAEKSAWLKKHKQCGKLPAAAEAAQ